jgi:hypothetical protein
MRPARTQAGAVRLACPIPIGQVFAQEGANRIAGCAQSIAVSGGNYGSNWGRVAAGVAVGAGVAALPRP